MTFHEKLTRLLETSNISAVCRKVEGLHPATVVNLLNRRNLPMVNTATKLARALNVDVGWLIDDSRDWPPIRTEQPVSTRTTTNAA